MRQGWRARRDSACSGKPRRQRGPGTGPQKGGPRTAEKTPEDWVGDWKRLRPYWGHLASRTYEPRPCRSPGIPGERPGLRPPSQSPNPRPGRPRPLTPGSHPSADPGPDPARGPHPSLTDRLAYTPALPRGREWCGPAPPPDASEGQAPVPSRDGGVTSPPLAMGGFRPGSGALGSRRCRGDGGSRSRSWSSRRSGGGGRGPGSRSAACTPRTSTPPSACGATLGPQDGRRIRGPGLRGQRPDHRGSFRGAGRRSDGAQSPVALREAAHPGVGPGAP